MNQPEEGPIVIDSSGAAAYASRASESAKWAAEICRRVAETKNKEVLGLYQLSEKFDAMVEGWTVVAHTAGSGQSASAIQSGAQALIGLTQYLAPLATAKSIDPIIETAIVSGDSMGAVTLSVVNLAVPEPPERVLRILGGEISKQKEFVTDKLPKDISPTFTAAWENLASDFSDPARGAAFLMREVVRHTLDYYAPESAIKSCGWFKPDPDSKSGITRRHRIRYIVERYFSEKPYMNDTLQALEDSYGDLSEAHARGPLEKRKVESYMYQATKILYEFLDGLQRPGWSS